MGDFATVNGIYGRFFPEEPPARATFAVKTLPLNAKVGKAHEMRANGSLGRWGSQGRTGQPSGVVQGGELGGSAGPEDAPGSGSDRPRSHCWLAYPSIWMPERPRRR
jgi:hypothetical protein